MEINLGNQIKELRKKKNMTQEQLADVLGISAQAVSKWEMGTGYPDITVVPVIANYFGVSLDDLFDYNTEKIGEKIDKIISESGRYFWSDFKEAEKILKEALKEYPQNERILQELLTLYECNMRSDKALDKYGEAVWIGEQLIGKAEDIFVVCSAKNDLASIHKMNGRYEKAKELIDSLPYMYPYMLNDKMRSSSYILEGEDRLSGAGVWKLVEIQELYIACEQEGKGFYETGDYEKALESFVQGQNVLEIFMKEERIHPESYLWDGMQTHHWSIYLNQAGCLCRLGNIEMAKIKIKKAYEIITQAWGAEFEKRPEYFMKPFREEYGELGLFAAEPCC